MRNLKSKEIKEVKGGNQEVLIQSEKALAKCGQGNVKSVSKTGYTCKNNN